MRRQYIKQYIINNQIRAKEVRLIDEKGERIGVLPIEKALDLAEEKSLDLLLMSADANPPVCKLVDFEHFRYEQQKKDKLAKKSSKSNVLKELKLSPNISEHDFQVRLTNAKKFLGKRFKVKVTIFFRGRQIAHPELGRQVITRFVEELKEISNLEDRIFMNERLLTATLNPK